jgi:hypothetical protein
VREVFGGGRPGATPPQPAPVAAAPGMSTGSLTRVDGSGGQGPWGSAPS